MTPEQEIQLGNMDIRYWLKHNKICPNCGLDFSKCHPAMNAIPHWTGSCNQTPEDLGSDVAKEASMHMTGKALLRFFGGVLLGSLFVAACLAWFWSGR